MPLFGEGIAKCCLHKPLAHEGFTILRFFFFMYLLYSIPKDSLTTLTYRCFASSAPIVPHAFHDSNIPVDNIDYYESPTVCLLVLVLYYSSVRVRL